MSDFEKHIDEIRRYFDEHKAERYPFENALLGEKDEYVKSLYFRMLCTLVRYTGEPGEMQALYIRRLIAGSHAESEYPDYMKMALDLDREDIGEFISMFGENDLKYYFCIDGAIVLTVGESSDKNYELLAELIELLGITRDELTYLISVSKAIISLNSDQFEEAKRNSPETTKELSLYHYAAGFYTGMLVDTPELRHIYSCNKAEINLSNYTDYKAERVILENVTISLQESIVFDGCSEVIMRRCSFHGNSCPFEFRRVGQVIIEECEISDFSNRFAVFTDTSNLYLRRNRFINCGCTNANNANNVFFSNTIYGGVLLSNGEEMDSVVIENNKLLNFYVRNAKSNGCGVSGILLHLERGVRQIIVTGNRFSGCECYNNGNRRESYITGLYADNAYETDNVCEGPVRRIFEWDA